VTGWELNCGPFGFASNALNAEPPSVLGVILCTRNFNSLKRDDKRLAFVQHTRVQVELAADHDHETFQHGLMCMVPRTPAYYEQ